MRVILFLILVLSIQSSVAITKEEAATLSPFIRNVTVVGKWQENEIEGYYRFVVSILDNGGFDNYQYQLFVQWINDDTNSPVATIEIKELVSERYSFSLPECLNRICSEFKINASLMDKLGQDNTFTIRLSAIGKYSVIKRS
jgi:hypothetical protein